MGRVLAITQPPSLEVLAATLKRYVEHLPLEDLPALAGELEAAKVQLWARATTPALTPAPDSKTELLDAKGMAERLGVPESWVREQARQRTIPCRHVGRYVRFDPTAVLRVLDNEQKAA